MMKKIISFFALSLLVLASACLPQGTGTGPNAGLGPLGADGGGAETVYGGGGEDLESDAAEIPDGGTGLSGGAVPPQGSQGQSEKTAGSFDPGVYAAIPMKEGAVAPVSDVGEDWIWLLEGTKTEECALSDGTLRVHVVGRAKAKRTKNGEIVEGYEDPIEGDDGTGIRVRYKKHPQQFGYSFIDVPLTKKPSGGVYQLHALDEPMNYVDFVVFSAVPDSFLYNTVHIPTGSFDPNFGGLQPVLADESPVPVPACMPSPRAVQQLPFRVQD